jgi:hypothetical protein
VRALPALWLMFGLACAADAADVRLRFTRAAEMPDSGLRLLLPSGAEADPLPPPAIMDGYMEANGKRTPMELQNPLEAWRWKQREGRWVDPRGTRLILAAATLPPPDWKADWMPREEVARLLAVNPSSGRSWGGDELSRWLGVFWGLPQPPPAERLTRNRPFAMSDAYLFRKPAPAPGLACAFRLKSGPEFWRFVLLEPSPDAKADSVESAFLEDLLPSIQYLGRRAAPSAAFPQGAPAPAGKPLAPREESLRRAREGIRNMKGWWAVEGPHTIILSNIKSGKSQLVDAVLEDTEALRVSWEAAVPPWEENREVAVIRIFGTSEEYVRYVGPDQAWTAGVWVPAHRELAIRPLEEGGGLGNRRAVLATVYHEAFHQYLDEAFGRIQAAPWFNEGYAQLFSHVEFAGRRVKVEKDPAAAALLATMAKAGQLDLSRLFALDYPGFYAKDERVRREHYALAWGFLYFLHQGDRKSEPWRALPARYAAALRETRDPAAATGRALAGTDMTALTEAFQQFWR